jgi:triosephosphate isomerase
MKKLLISNLKSNKSVEEANLWLDELVSIVKWTELGIFEVGVAPAFTSVEEFSHKIKEAGVPLKLITQDISAFPAGSYTGATSFKNLSDLNISYAIVGHSERRRYFAETSEMVAKKVEQAVENGITPLLCIDEPYLEEQFNLISSELLSKCIICYEPLEAIGSGKSVGVNQVETVKNLVKKLAGDVLFMYGGSVTDRNVSEYLMVTDGVLVGSFTLKASDFAKLISKAIS